MKIHRFHINFDNSLQGLSTSDAEVINQIRNVLRLKIGNTVSLFDGIGNEVNAKIISITDRVINFEFTDLNCNNPEPNVFVNLYCSVLKKENFEFVVQKATEIGVSEVTPILTSRTVKLNLRNERLQKIIKEASEQSGRVKIPKLNNLINLETAISVSKKADDLILFFDMSGINLDISNLIKKEKYFHVGLFIGPEGGWSKEELELAKKAKLKIISLGKTTLRAETAAIVCSYLATNTK